VSNYSDKQSNAATEVRPAPWRKNWKTPAVIVSTVRTTEGHVTIFTDGTDLGVPYGS
jgi:hypothetical protein